MTKPLALLVYEKLLPGSQLVNRLQDLGYRVQTMTDSVELVPQAEREKPLMIIIDLTANQDDLCRAIKQIKDNPATDHIPILALTGNQNPDLQTIAHEAGATLVASDQAILAQLPQLLDQIVRVD